MMDRGGLWRGVVVATTLPFMSNGTIDFDAYAEHVSWLIESGCDGVAPNGSLGEYQSLTVDERAMVVRVAVEAAGGHRVMPGVSAYGAMEAARWADQAAESGCAAVMLLPPHSYRADERSVFEHFKVVSKVGLPIVGYNNPVDTRVDMTPTMMASLYEAGFIHAVKEFSGDVRRVYELVELAPELDVVVGSDDVLLEMMLAGAVGWIAGYPNALPRACVGLYRMIVDGDVSQALARYRQMHGLLRWDSKVEFVQAIKQSMDVVGRWGRNCRPPRLPLSDDIAESIRGITLAVQAGIKDA